VANVFDPMVNHAKGAISAVTTVLHKGIIKNASLGIYIMFQYNPKETSDSTPVTFKKKMIQGGASPLISFQVRDAPTKSFELLLDAHSTPTLRGHIAQDLDDIEMLTVPYDEDGRPIIIPPRRMEKAIIKTRSPLIQSKKVVGVPPMVKIAYGGRVQVGFISNLTIKEELHGTTLGSMATAFPTRAHVTFEFLIVDDKRMAIYFEATQP